MSPEQVRGEDSDHRADIFSLGTVLYEMVTGQRAFRGASSVETLNAILKEDPPRMDRAAPPALDRIVQRCLEKRPEERFQSARDVGFALEAVSDERPAGDLTTSKPGRARWLGAAVLCAAIMLVIGLWWIRSGPVVTEEAPTTAEIAATSIAVLPFDDLSPDRESEYFGDGMAEELLNALAKIPGLKVAARTSAFSFKGKSEDIRVIGERLNVANVLTGSVRRSGDQIRITVQLNSAADGFSLWSEQYDRELVDVFAVQGEIARSIADRLEVSLGKGDEPVVRAATSNMEAYDLYLKGRFFWEQRGEGLHKGLELFERAIELDPDFAQAYAGAADAYGLLSSYGDMQPREGLPKARSAAERAMELDEGLAEVHSAVASVSWASWDWRRAEQEFLRAIELNPSYAPAHNFYGQYLLLVKGRAKDAVIELQRTVELDPLNAHALAILGQTLMGANRLPEALDVFRRAKELDPTLFHPRAGLVLFYLLESREAEALAEAETAVEALGRNPWLMPALGGALAAGGRVVEAEQVLKELVDLSDQHYVSPALIACTSAWVGRREDAFQWLDRAYRERDPVLSWYSSCHWWTPTFCSDPRFRELRKRMGLE
jgi:serine/threonine-protein kinase